MKNTIEQNLQQLNQLILEGKAMEAFERFYSDDIVMQENENPPTVGKEANRKREIEFFNSITEFRGATLLSFGAGENKTFTEWSYDYTHKDWGVRKYKQVAVQTWKDGKIINEKFYYGA